ncbi:MAG TPA: hypothetical protein VM571_00635 [Noviherbaspirillum sp.]|nr:hypothetical protein [Noviherbaspirillum sp.]
MNFTNMKIRTCFSILLALFVLGCNLWSLVVPDKLTGVPLLSTQQPPAKAGGFGITD